MSLKDYEIKFSGLGLGEHQYDYKLNKEFFDLFDYQGLERSDLKVNLALTKKNSSIELAFVMDGKATVACDLTNEDFDLPLKNDLNILVKFGEEYDDTDEDILIIPFSEHTINISQYLYELSVLSLPLKKVHPDVEKGTKGKEVLKKLKELSPDNEEETENKEVDPRWDKLKSLLN